MTTAMRRRSGLAVVAVLPLLVDSFVLFKSKSLTSTTKRRRHGTSLDVAAAATAWPFTPDRTPSVLAERSADALAAAGSVVADVALEYATHAALASSTVVYKAPLLSLAISFLLGGLFFSTVAAIVTGVIALGRENTRRAKDVLLIVIRRNWSVVKLSAQFTLNVLRGKEQMSGFKNRIPAALQALRDGIAEIRRVFTESVDAIKKETQMYSAAIGLPGLIPIQYIFDRIFPSMLTAPFESAIEDALLQTAKDNPQIQKLTLRRFSMGDVAPRLLEARLFDLGNRDMAFDLEMSWTSKARADIDLRISTFGTKIPVTIQNLRFDGPVRLILVGLRREEPGWEAMLISLPRPPKIGFDVKVAGGMITQIPWLQSYFAKMLDKSVADEVLWPRRAVVSAPAPFKSKPLLNPMQILSLMRDDPLLRMERELIASIPDDFRTGLENDNANASQFDIQVKDTMQRHTDDEDGEINDGNNNGGDDSSMSLGRRLRFWQRQKREEVEIKADAVQLMGQYLRNEAMAQTKIPTMVMVDVDEQKSLVQRALREVLLPRSLLSFAGKEGGII